MRKKCDEWNIFPDTFCFFVIGKECRPNQTLLHWACQRVDELCRLAAPLHNRRYKPAASHAAALRLTIWSDVKTHPSFFYTFRARHSSFGNQSDIRQGSSVIPLGFLQVCTSIFVWTLAFGVYLYIWKFSVSSLMLFCTFLNYWAVFFPNLHCFLIVIY